VKKKSAARRVEDILVAVAGEVEYLTGFEMLKDALFPRLLV
jgi:hypothetical protein